MDGTLYHSRVEHFFLHIRIVRVDATSQHIPGIIAGSRDDILVAGHKTKKDVVSGALAQGANGVVGTVDARRNRTLSNMVIYLSSLCWLNLNKL